MRNISIKIGISHEITNSVHDHLKWNYFQWDFVMFVYNKSSFLDLLIDQPYILLCSVDFLRKLRLQWPENLICEIIKVLQDCNSRIWATYPVQGQPTLDQGTQVMSRIYIIYYLFCHGPSYYSHFLFSIICRIKPAPINWQYLEISFFDCHSTNQASQMNLIFIQPF